MRLKSRSKSLSINREHREEPIDDDLEALKYFQSTSTKKQLSLLHSVLAGRMNSESRMFIKHVFQIKKSKIFMNKFKTLTNQAFPDVFL